MNILNKTSQRQRLGKPLFPKGTINRGLVFIILILLCASCKRQESIYEGLIVPGGKTYPGQALGVSIRPGDERIQISWRQSVDPKVVKARILWNNGDVAMTEEIDITPDMTTISHIIDPIPENDYSFTIHTYDADENRSIPVEVLGKVYGERYRNSLNNRGIKSALYDGRYLLLTWLDAVSTEIRVELSYTDFKGNKKSVTVSPSDSETLIEEFDNSQPLRYVSIHKPVSSSLDEFYAPEGERTVTPAPVEEIPKAGWQTLKLPSDIGQRSGYPLSLDRLWNGVISESGFYSDEDWALPVWFTFDLGANYVLSKIKLWPRADPNTDDDQWQRGQPKEFEIYGSLNPDPEGTWDISWILLGQFEWLHPDGKIFNSASDITADDLAIVKQGKEFEFVPTANADPSAAVRYLRFKCIKNYRFPSESQTSPVTMAEISLWGTRSLNQ